MRRYTTLCEDVATSAGATLAHEGANGMKIWYYGSSGHFYAIIQRTGKAKALKRGDHLKLRSEARREEWAQEQLEGAKSRADRVADRKEEDRAHRTSLVVGSIIYSTWGYEQTNVDFAEVVSVNPSGKTVMVRAISKRLESNEGGSSMSGNAFPVPGSFNGEAKIFRPKKFDSGRMGDQHYSKWNGGPVYCSWYA